MRRNGDVDQKRDLMRAPSQWPATAIELLTREPAGDILTPPRPDMPHFASEIIARLHSSDDAPAAHAPTAARARCSNGFAGRYHSPVPSRHPNAKRGQAAGGLADGADSLSANLRNNSDFEVEKAEYSTAPHRYSNGTMTFSRSVPFGGVSRSGSLPNGSIFSFIESGRSSQWSVPCTVDVLAELLSTRCG